MGASPDAWHWDGVPFAGLDVKHWFNAVSLEDPKDSGSVTEPSDAPLEISLPNVA